MWDIGEVIRNKLALDRQKVMKTSEQLMLIELIIALEGVPDKSVPVVFDEAHWPVDISSWRGSYSELAVEYGGDKHLAVSEFLYVLKEAIGQKYEGYKGGEFLMGKNTPLWVANYGRSEGFDTNDNNDRQAITGIEIFDDKVIIKTQLMAY